MIERKLTLSTDNENTLFWKYFKEWAEREKKGVVRDVTYVKYKMNARMIQMLAPNTKIKDLTRAEYRRILNKYAESHEKFTIRDFHRHMKACIQDICYEGLLEKDPTYKVKIPQGKPHKVTRSKYLEEDEIERLTEVLEKDNSTYGDLCLIDLKTGMRLAEILGITPNDLDFSNHIISINKTWNYKNKGGFIPTKNASSVRDIYMDPSTEQLWRRNMEGAGDNEAIFGSLITYNSVVNDYLTKVCKKAKVPRITFHGLRHTHASYLIAQGVSIQSVANRLGHADTTTTQQTYIHLLKKLEMQDNKKIQELMSK